MGWLQNISITCFAASYAVVLVLEVSRIFFHAPLRPYIRIGLMAAGLFAHTVFIINHAQAAFGSPGLWLGSWFGWCLAGAWVLAGSYLWLSLNKPKSLTGLFLLPITLMLVGFGYGFIDADPFSPGRAKTIWNWIHGYSLLLGTVAVALGFTFGVMYLVQSIRLKQKRSGRFRLPSLEWLHLWSERCMIASTALLCGGLASGIALKMVQQNSADRWDSVPWTDPVIWSSGILFLWLFLAGVISLVYRPVREGRKVAYLVSISFLFLLLELVIVWQVGHGTQNPPATSVVLNRELGGRS